MKRIFLVRHAEPDGLGAGQMNGWHDVPLSDRGLEQAELVGAAMAAEVRGAAIYASPLQRTRRTAEAISRSSCGDIRLVGSLKEIGCGEVDGWPVTRVQELYPDLWARNLAQDDDDFCWPGGETYRRVRQRALRAIRTIGAMTSEAAVIVTHTGVITQIVGALRGTSPAKWEAYRVRHASVTELRCDGERAEVVAFDRVFY